MIDKVLAINNSELLSAFNEIMESYYLLESHREALNLNEEYYDWQDG